MRRAMLLASVLALNLFTTACKSGYRNAAATAAFGTELGLIAAGLSRSGGGCYARCPTGTACNHVNGLCEELPCRGACAFGEHCGPTNRCEPGITHDTSAIEDRPPPPPPHLNPADNLSPTPINLPNDRTTPP